MDWLIFGALNIIFVTILFLLLSRRINRQYNSAHFLDRVQDEVNSIITELNQTTERNIQLIEDRISKLNRILEQVDKRIVLATKEEERRGSADRTYSDILEKRRSVRKLMGGENEKKTELLPFEQAQEDPDPSASIRPAASAVEESGIESSGFAFADRSPQGQSAGRHESQGDQRSLSREETVAKTPEIPLPLSREAMKAQVVTMHEAGIASALIAQRFGISMGEVELIVSLNTAPRKSPAT